MGEFGVPVLPLNVEIGYTLLIAATVLTIITGWTYVKEGMKHL